jgi:hypothetical protein
MRTAAVAVLGARVAYGAALLAAPQRVTKAWLGPVDDPAKVALRGLAAREIAVHGFGIAAALTGAPLKPWLAASVIGDASDIVATIMGRSGLPDRSAKKTAAVAGVSAALTVAVLAAA